MAKILLCDLVLQQVLEKGRFNLPMSQALEILAIDDKNAEKVFSPFINRHRELRSKIIALLDEKATNCILTNDQKGMLVDLIDDKTFFPIFDGIRHC